MVPLLRRKISKIGSAFCVFFFSHVNFQRFYLRGDEAAQLFAVVWADVSVLFGVDGAAWLKCKSRLCVAGSCSYLWYPLLKENTWTKMLWKCKTKIINNCYNLFLLINTTSTILTACKWKWKHNCPRCMWAKVLYTLQWTAGIGSNIPCE